MYRPQTNLELWAFIGAHFGLWLPHKIFTPGHSSPFAFVADCWFHPGDDIAAWASRSGIKTLGVSVIAAMEFAFTDNLQARVLSGSEDQARNLYEYWEQWCYFLSDRITGDIKKHLTRVAGGRMEILAASEKRVRGPKVHRLYEDELDSIEADIDKAAAGMISSHGGIPGSTRYTSTWHRVDGQMARLVDGTPENGVRLHKWNVWESIARCDEDRHQGGRGCDECELEPACRLKARQFHRDPERRIGIAAEAAGLYAVDDVIKVYLKVGHRTWEAEYECKRPAVEGAVYPEFDELEHRCQKPPAAMRVYRVIDWGFNTFVCLWLGQDKNGTVYLLHTYKAERARLRVHADYILSQRGSIVGTFCDPAGRNKNDQTGRSDVEEFAGYGINCTYALSAWAHEIANGIQLVRAALKPASGPPRFYYVPGDTSRTFVRDIQSYINMKRNDVYVDYPKDPQPAEHTMDALRYFFVNRMEPPRQVRSVGLGTG